LKSGTTKPVRCAIYTRVSTDHGLEQDFNSLDAQHDAAQAYIRSQAHAGWTLIRARYDDGGYSGGSTDTRPREAAAGLTNFLPTRTQMRKASPSASGAAFARST
jgi:hypothetical protein